MKIDKRIFKTYDVRGVYPDQLNEEVAEIIGTALGSSFGRGPIAIGRDVRLSSDSLFSALTKGLMKAGTDIHDLGLVPIDAVYFSIYGLRYSGAVMVTASHNPKEYNGFKIVKGGMEWVWGKDVGKMIEQPAAFASGAGGISKFDIWPKYLNHLFSLVDVSKIKPLKVVVDAGNGLAGQAMPRFGEKLPIEIIPMFFEPDGNFPNHSPNPLMPESQVAIREKVLREKADFGVIFDADTDRLFFVDERGEFIRADMTLLLLAKLMLDKEPGAAVVYNVICSKMVREQIKAWGGQPIRSAVGYANMTKNMKEHNAVMSGELSSHYTFRETGNSDSGFAAFLILLQVISEAGKPLSEMVQPFIKYAKGDEINFPLESVLPDNVILELEGKYRDGRRDKLDGLTVEYDNWWFNVRPSNTEPLLRVTVEADTPELLKEKQEELSEFINKLVTD